ncbi:cysteine peptidase family C39 domain-containing protein, partial [Kitasatospora sp. NPDC058263]
MLVEALEVLALAGGGAVVNAAGTDAWNGLRRRVAEIFGCGDAARGQAELERLDHTARILVPGASADIAAERLRQEGVWQERFETLLESLDSAERELAAQQLRELLSFVPTSAGDTAIATGKAVARDGSRAGNLLKAARGYGLTAKGMQMDLAALAEVNAPAILFWEFNHYVVYEGTTRRLGRRG